MGHAMKPTPVTIARAFLAGRPIAGIAFDNLVTVEAIEGLLRKRLETLLKRKGRR